MRHLREKKSNTVTKKIARGCHWPIVKAIGTQIDAVRGRVEQIRIDLECTRG
jgi:hypothetical protein